ncbi:hypothetical protein, partial [Yersinia kristensenii]|uniref:hypothetical protein n=1 Tax=Yersinia kristensenii TaxID=28152 RepID=UPI001C60A599
SSGFVHLLPTCDVNDFGDAYVLEAAGGVSCAHAPESLTGVSSSGFVHLLPTCDVNDFGDSYVLEAAGVTPRVPG